MKKIKFISPSLHGILDYMVDITLISVPLIFNFRAISDTVFWVPIAIGLSNLLYSLFTVYSRSLVPLIPFYLHLFFDFMAGLILLALAFSLPLEGFVKLFYIAMGGGIILATLFTNPNESDR